MINKRKDRTSGMKIDPDLVDQIVHILKKKGVKEKSKTRYVKYVLNRYIEDNSDLLDDYTNGDNCGKNTQTKKS